MVLIRKIVISAGSPASLKREVDLFKKRHAVLEVTTFSNNKPKNGYNTDEYIEYCASITYTIASVSPKRKH